jgi:hypothetical protein
MGTTDCIERSVLLKAPARRLAVFRENTEGWDAQMRNIAQHVAAS